jgi:hypothetical protein
MQNIVILIAAIAGLSFIIKESDGPWGIMAWIRNVLVRNKYVGVFFYKLFMCPVCVGSHVGYMIYLLATPKFNWSINDFIIWTFAGGAINLLFTVMVDKLMGIPHD